MSNRRKDNVVSAYQLGHPAEVIAKLYNTTIEEVIHIVHNKLIKDK
ncbi:MAG: hypothetical protein GQ570_08555 [Helicobacteraceae bacterium]|nr:hypothetical protein [Helicobacteraceae bacterium]